MKKLVLITIAILFGIVGCHTHDHDDIPKIPTISITQWTPKMELFMEHESAVVGNEIKFIIHLTMMDDFKPVREG